MKHVSQHMHTIVAQKGREDFVDEEQKKVVGVHLKNKGRRKLGLSLSSEIIFHHGN